MTSRAELQGKSIRDLRQIAEAVGIETDGLQKAHLIDAIMNADGYSRAVRGSLWWSFRSAAPARTEAPGPEAETSTPGPRVETEDEPATTRLGSERPIGRDIRREWDGRAMAAASAAAAEEARAAKAARVSDRRGYDRPMSDREPQIPEGELEIRQGILDILPEGYGFLRVTSYLPGDRDVYVSASQVRKFGLRRGDLVEGPIRPPRSQEKFPALIRIDSVNGMIGG